MAASRCARSRFRRSVIESLEARQLLAIALAGHTVEENSAHGAIINPANGHAYYLLGASSWQDAEASAISLGGHLVTINDRAEQDWVFNTFSNYHGVIRSLWLGLTDQGHEGNFQWSSGEPVTFINWVPGQPDNQGGNENFAHTVPVNAPYGWQAGFWNDVPSPIGPSDWDPLCGVVETTPSTSLNTVVGTLSGTNPDNGQTLTFTLLDDANGAFALDGNDLVVVQPLDHEATPSVQITVRGADHDGHTFDQAFTINVVDMPEAPTDIELSGATVAENEPAGTTVGTFSFTDPDVAATATYSLVSGTGDGSNVVFTIEGDTLKTAMPLDFEDRSQHSIRVSVKDAKGFSFEKIFTIDVTDVFEVPSIRLSNNSVVENALHGGIINPANGHIYFLLAPSSWHAAEDQAVALGGHLVTVNNAAEQLWISSTFSGKSLWLGLNDEQHEGVFQWTSGEPVTFTNWDSFGNPSNSFGTEDYTVSNPVAVKPGEIPGPWNDLSNVPDPVYSGIVYGLAEVVSPVASPRTVIGAVNPANGHGYYLLPETTWVDAEAAAVSLGGHLVTINDAAEQEWVFNTFNAYQGVYRNLWIGLTDKDQEGSFQWVSGEPFAYSHWMPGSPDDPNDEWHALEDYVEMQSVLEPAPWIPSDWNDVWNDTQPVAPTCGVVETATPLPSAKLVIGTLSGKDAPPLTYSLLDDAGGKVAIDGNHLVVAAAFDYETTPSVQVTVRGDDGNGHTYDQTFTIHIIDANEAPSSLALSPKQVSENMPPNTTVGVFTASDIDLGDQSTYTLVAGPGSADNGFFSIAGAALKTKVSFDFETTPSYSIRVRATDSGGLSVEKAFAINVLEANDAPQLNAALSPSLGWISENATNPGGTMVKYVGGGISDVDPQPLKGIAVTGVSGKISGHWQYTINGTTWLELGSPSESAARLLPINDVAKVRYVPQAGFAGEVQLYFRAWDRTAGSAGGTMNTAGNLGGMKPLSTSADGAALTIKPVNDKPVLTLSGSLSYVSKAAAVVLAPNATVTDVDSANFAGGLLNVHVATGGNAANRLAIGGGFTVDASNNVKLNGVTIGQRTGNGVGTNWLLVKFNANATKAIVQQLVRSITFKTAATSPGQRKIVFSVSDGDGGLSDERTKTVNVS